MPHIETHTPFENRDRGEGWDDQAACAPLIYGGIFDEYFYPERYNRTSAYVILAKRICAACPVLLECRADALSNGDMYGIKGGMTPLERKEFIKRVIPTQRGPEDAA